MITVFYAGAVIVLGVIAWACRSLLAPHTGRHQHPDEPVPYWPAYLPAPAPASDPGQDPDGSPVPSGTPRPGDPLQHGAAAQVRAGATTGAAPLPPSGAAPPRPGTRTSWELAASGSSRAGAPPWAAAPPPGAAPLPRSHAAVPPAAGSPGPGQHPSWVIFPDGHAAVTERQQVRIRSLDPSARAAETGAQPALNRSWYDAHLAEWDRAVNET